MLTRAGGRLLLLPLNVLGWPLLVVGLYQMMGIVWQADDVGTETWTVVFQIPAPSLWLQDTASFVGLGMAITGALCLILALLPWRRDRFLVARRFGAFTLAAVAFGGAGLYGLYHLSGHVVDVASGGFEWRFVARLRSGALNQAFTWTAFALAAVCLLLSFGRKPRRAARPWPTAAPVVAGPAAPAMATPTVARPVARAALAPARAATTARRAPVDFDAQRSPRERQRVPASTATRPVTSKAMAKGASTQRASGVRPMAKGDGPDDPS